jgi:large subunit ribosomal protein L15
MNLKIVCAKGTKHRNMRRVGRGIGSGNGKTSGRGHKGWGARSGSSRRPGYEGGQMPLYRRVPKRGFTNARFRVDYTVINVDRLEGFDNGAEVTLDAVRERGLVGVSSPFLKVLGNGALSKKLTVKAQSFSKTAMEKITAAGGTALVIGPRGEERRPEA